MRYYTMELQPGGKSADILIYGDITSFRWLESDVSGYSFADDLQALGAVDEITVHINSYGGEVSEGFAIYNILRNHPARITTVCDGFACSAASVIFMAGERRVMNPASALWIHNVQSYESGDARKLRKAADNAEKLTEASKTAYTSVGLNISDEELSAMMDEETWIMPEDALTMGFATEIVAQEENNRPTQSAKHALFELLVMALEEDGSEEDEAEEPDKEKPTPTNPDEDDEESGDEGTPEEEPDTDDDADEPDDEDDDTDREDDDPAPDTPPRQKADQQWYGFFHALMNHKEDEEK